MRSASKRFREPSGLGPAIAKSGKQSATAFETELLANDENLAALADLSGVWIDRVHARKLPRMIVLDMDSSVMVRPGAHPASSQKERPS